MKCENCARLIRAVNVLCDAIDTLNNTRDDHPNPLQKMKAYNLAFAAQDLGRATVKSIEEAEDEKNT